MSSVKHHNLHPSEIAALQREQNWNPDLMAPRVEPGSYEEQQALERIDMARDNEMAQRGDSFAQRRRRARKYWSKGF